MTATLGSGSKASHVVKSEENPQPLPSSSLGYGEGVWGVENNDFKCRYDCRCTSSPQTKSWLMSEFLNLSKL